MVNPINNDDAALMLSKFGTKYLAEGEHTDVSASQFVAQAATTLTVLTGGDAAISDNNKDYLASMSLGSVELKAGALIVAPNGELFKSITVATGGALVAYNSVIEGVKPGSFVGLLDTYPDAAAAYSLRKLRTNYSGSAIRVRRADNTEQDIGFVNNELDTTSLLSFVGSGDGFVAILYDQSLNAKNQVQTTAIYQPKIVSSGVIELLNSLPSMLGDDSSMGSESFKYTGSNGEFSAYGVYNLKTDSGYTTAFGSNDTPRIGQFPTAFNGQIRNVATTDSGDSLLRSDLADNTNIVFNGNVSTTTNDLYINGVLKDTDTFTGNLANASNSLFSFARRVNTSAIQGHISEMIIYPANQTTDRSAIETNINDFYSIY